MKQWECQRDGACCRTIGAVAMTRAEWALLEQRRPLRPVQLDTERLQAQGMVEMRAEPCPFFRLATNECTVYDVRPYNCRRFQCGRHDVIAQPFPQNAMRLILADNDLKWSYEANQRAHQPWARAHGWTDDAG